MQDYEQAWESYWKDIVMPGGVLDLDQLKRELYDYGTLGSLVSEVYDSITGGQVSKVFTDPKVVIGLAKEFFCQYFQDDYYD